MKKIIILGLSAFIIIASLTGCMSKDQNTQLVSESNSEENFSPHPVISAPKKVDFGESIDLDASNSYDKDGEIESYRWHIGNGDLIEGKKVSYTFNFPENFELKKCPYIYKIQLEIGDDKGSVSYAVDQIFVSPKDYTLYLDSNSFSKNRPAEKNEEINPSLDLFRNTDSSLTYKLENKITIQNCSWAASIYLDKPISSLLRDISFILYNQKGEKITTETKELDLLNSFWKAKKITFTGEITHREEFKSAEITINGFSFLRKPSILYGGETASNLTFDFEK